MGYYFSLNILLLWCKFESNNSLLSINDCKAYNIYIIQMSGSDQNSKIKKLMPFLLTRVLGPADRYNKINNLLTVNHEIFLFVSNSMNV